MSSSTTLPIGWSTPSVAGVDGNAARRSTNAHGNMPARGIFVQTLERLKRRVAGRLVAWLGSINIVVGTVVARRQLIAAGHRQRVVGMLQLNCEVDRRTADAFVDRWMSKRATMAAV